jgi:hypothetical protein
MQHTQNHITHEDVEHLKICEHRYMLNRTRVASAPLTTDQRVAMASGRAHHKAAATTDPVLRAEIIEHQLSRVPFARREALRAEITDMVAHADNSAMTEDAGLQREVQLLWTDPKTGWTFAAKPDLHGEADDRIILGEEKRAKRFYDSHRMQIWFAAFVKAHIQADQQAALPPEERRYKPIEVFVRCSRFIQSCGKKKRMWERKFRYPLHRLEQETWTLRNLVKKIIRRERSNYFIPKLELSACATCPFRGECAPLLRNAPLLTQVKAEEIRLNRPTAFVEVSAIAPAAPAQSQFPAPAQPPAPISIINVSQSSSVEAG